jgi:hypothetical protein
VWTNGPKPIQARPRRHVKSRSDPYQKFRVVGFLQLIRPTGFARTTIAEAAGTGTERVYSLRDLIALRVARDLREQGIGVVMLRQVIR